MSISTRAYQPADAKALAAIFYHTIHQINCQDYTQAQLDVWAPKTRLDHTGWVSKWEKLVPIVAVVDEQVVGFTEFEPTGHIDCFYVHHEWIGKGVGTALMQTVELQAAEKNIRRLYLESSITAKPFFEAKGFKVLKQQTIERKGVSLTNFVMEKILEPILP